jgi:flagellar protein FliS
MHFSAREAYLETQVATATPQRLRLMLIEAALRRARAAQRAWIDDKSEEAHQALTHCREIMAELIAGIRPEDSPLAKQVLGIYLFLFSAATEAQLTKDSHRLQDIIRILEEERITWQAVCEQMTERPVAAPAAAAEEIAPQRVDANWTPSYGRLPQRSAASAFSIDA